MSIGVLGHLAKENEMINPSSLGLQLGGISQGFQGEQNLSSYLGYSNQALKSANIQSAEFQPNKWCCLMRKVRDTSICWGHSWDRTLRGHTHAAVTRDAAQSSTIRGDLYSAFLTAKSFTLITKETTNTTPLNSILMGVWYSLI